VLRYFDGLQLVPPGLVRTTHWHADRSELDDPAPIASYSAIGQKP
jgi:S-adenosyl methyltransferase